MKLPQNKIIKKWNYLAIAFGIPFICFCFVLIFGGYEPFGNGRALLYSDQYHQYYPFFVSFRNALRSGDSLLYNWEYGMGLDHLGLISYYLGSPLNFLSILIPESLLLEYFCLLTPLKLGLASLFFAIFLRKLFRRDDLSIALFGSLYGMCAWALAYQWNVMWLDTFALLPLVTLGTICLLRDKKFILYTVSLFLSVAINYYIGFFTCIFVLLIFICYEICRFRSIRRLCSDFLRIGIFTLLALGATMLITLPAFSALQTTQSSVNNFPKGFRLNIADENTWQGLLDGMRQVVGNMGGGLTPSWKEGLPNLYSGVGTVLLAFLFLSSKNIRLRDKICSVILLLLFIVSFLIRQLDYIWHGFHFTNMIPYRFSFLFSFVMLTMAYQAYLERKRFQIWQIVVGAALSIGVFICSDLRTDIVFIAYNLIFLSLYAGILIYGLCHRKPPREASHEERKVIVEERRQKYAYATFGLAGILAVEIIINTVNFGVSFPYTGVSNYPKGTEDTAAVLDYMEQQEDSLFYRTEVTHSQTLNDGALNGYNGISTFTSSANVAVTEFMEALGYGAKNTYNRYCFEESSPVANLFLALKYMVERDGCVESNAYFDTVYQSGNVYLQENNAYLPLSFLAGIQIANLEFTSVGNTITFQNRLLRAAAEIDEDVWLKIPREYVAVSGENVDVTTVTGGGYCSYHASEAGTLIYHFTANTNGFLCIDLNLPKKNSYSVYLNGVKLYDETYSLPQCIAVSDVVVGDVVEVKLNCKAGEKSSMTVEAAILDDAVFRKAYSKLSASTLELTHFSNTKVAGTIVCDREEGLMYTSIPQDGNWQVTVDGVAIEPVLVGDVMIGVPLTEGTHTVTFVYRNNAFAIGCAVSIGCILVFAVILFAVYKPIKRKGKFEK